MDLPPSSSLSTLHNVKERMKEKINRTLKAAKLQTSLAAKIKAKNLSNSSLSKISLKNNNRTLACALTTEREKARRLENDKMFLQKEVKMLHFQNALLRQNLSILNKMLKDIDLFMNVNLSTAIELSSINESLDITTEEQKSERFSIQSRLSLDEHKAFRLTGLPLRVPSGPSEQQITSSAPSSLLNEDKNLTAVFSPNKTVSAESTDGQHETMHPSERLGTINCDLLSNVETGDFASSWDSDLIASSRSGFVTRRRKRSTVSRSSTQSVSSDINQSKISVDSCRESVYSTQFDINKDQSLPTALEPAKGAYEDAIHNGYVKSKTVSSVMSPPTMQSNRNKESLHASHTENVLESPVQPNLGHPENVLETTVQPNLVNSRGKDFHPVDCPVEQEQTVYEADMEMTSIDSAAIVAILPKKKTKTVKSGIPRKQDGASLRKVRISHEKTKKQSSTAKKDKESKEQINNTINVSENINVQCNPSKDLKFSSADGYNSRQTYVLTNSVNQDKSEDFECGTKSNRQEELVTSLINCIAEDSFTGNINVCNKENDMPSAVTNTLSLEEPCCVDDTVHKKRKSKIHKESSKDMENIKKKRRKVTEVLREQEDGSTETNTGIDEETLDLVRDSRETLTIDRPHMKTRELQIRRETYVIGSVKPTFMLCQVEPKDSEIKYRRETFIIPVPDPKILEENVGTNKHSLQTLNTVPSTAPQPEIQNVLHKKKDAVIVGHSLDTDSNMYNHKKEKVERSNNKGPSSLFSEDKRKTRILPTKGHNFRGDKDTLVRESFVHGTQSHAEKPFKILNAAMMSNKQDSFMLDMVSESILDETLDSPSFVEFPSTTNPDSTYMVNVTFNDPSLPPDPVSEDCNTSVSKEPDSPKSIGDLDENENNSSQELFNIDGNLQCKAEDCSMEIHEADVKPFQDLTNKAFGMTKQSPKTLDEEEDGRGHSRRRRNPVNYKEPSLGKKLRRGDSNTDTEFLNSPPLKGKGKKGGGKKKKVKSEDSTAK